MKLRSNLILLLLLMMVIFPGTISPSEARIREDEIKNPGKFIFERNDLSQTFDPPHVGDVHAAGLCELVYESLIKYKGNSAVELQSGLATNWTISEDRLTYAFSLRQDVTFHDGEPFNAYIMKFSLDRVIIMGDFYGTASSLTLINGAWEYMSYYDDHNVSLAIDYLNAGGIQVIDDYTLEINLETPSFGFINILTDFGTGAVSPKAVVENKPLDYTTNTSDNFWGMVPLDIWFPELTDYTKLGLPANHDSADSGVVPGSYEDSPSEHLWMRNHMVGTGPYKLVEIHHNDFFRLEKNNNWWGTFSEYSVDEIIIKHVVEVETRISHLYSGEADMIQIDLEDYPEVIDENGTSPPGIKVYEINSFYITCTFFNMWDYPDEPVWWWIPDAFNESDDSTYNASLLARYSTGSRTARQSNPFSSLLFRKAFASIFDYDAFIDQVRHGYGERMEGVIQKGMFGHHDQLLEEGHLPTYDPVKAKALFEQVGWKGTIAIPYIEQDIREDIVFMLKNPIEALDVGITIQAEPLDGTTYFNTFWQFPVFSFGLIAYSADPQGQVASFLHGEEGGWANTIGYNNPEITELIDQAAVEHNVTLREQLYHEIEEFGVNDSPILYLTQNQDLIITKDWIQNVEESGSLNPMSMILNLETIDKTYDTVPPTISNIYHTPVEPTSSDTVTVFADISDDSGILSATVHYRINGGSWHNVTMDPTTGNGYTVNIGSFDVGTTVEYYISTIDNSVKANSALKDNNGEYYQFVVSAVTTTMSTTQSSSEGSGFIGNELLVLSFIAILTIYFFRRKKKPNR